jgi:hypothetical protein
MMDDERVASDAGVVERGRHFADRPVGFHDEED